MACCKKKAKGHPTAFSKKGKKRKGNYRSNTLQRIWRLPTAR